MKLLDPNGVRISVSDERGERLKAQGYREVGAAESAPAPSPKPRRPRAKKTID